MNRPFTERSQLNETPKSQFEGVISSVGIPFILVEASFTFDFNDLIEDDIKHDIRLL
jgi:hypothetical protein